mmetsp:Transcript_8513/g.15430  ORF Transcript_8513/g.15430 Transcript_8513/m.15430 type:complete len:139 (-) Transcript_8513:83-499(-)
MVKPTSTFNFLGTVLLGVPLWITVLVPMALVTQLMKPKQSIDSDSTTSTTAPLELSTETYPEPNTTAREKRTYDIILLGATGFTGQLAVEYLTKQYGGMYGTVVVYNHSIRCNLNCPIYELTNERLVFYLVCSYLRFN